MLKIYYRSDLNMPRGKIIAQCSHALGALILGCFDFDKRKLKCTEKSIRQLIESVAIAPLGDAEFHQKTFCIQIHDQGRTVFKGVSTLTAGLSLDENILKIIDFKENSYEQELGTYPVRTLQLVNKQYARKNFEQAVLDAVKFQGEFLLKTLLEGGLNQRPEFLAWAKGSFAKIVLVCDEEFLKNLSEKSLTAPVGFSGRNFAMIGPVCRQDGEISLLTKDLKMM